MRLMRSVMALSVIAMTVTGCIHLPGAGRLRRRIDVGGHKLFISCAGTGEPTVILESGIGDAGSLAGWDVVRRNVSKFTRVCLYDRAGLGRSEPGPGPRSSQRIVGELHTLLQSAGLQPPYILVGHSFGGLHIQLFARHYPDEVVGMVFVDPSPRELVEALPPERLDELENMGVPPGALSEIGTGMSNSIPQIRELGQPPDVPAVVLTSSLPSGAQDGDLDLERWHLLSGYHQALADQFSDGVHIVATSAGHYIQRDEPQLVIDAIQRVLAKVAPR